MTTLYTHLGIRVRSHAPSIQSHRGTKVVWPDFQPMRVLEEPVCIELFRQNPVFTSLHFKSPVHVHRLWVHFWMYCICTYYWHLWRQSHNIVYVYTLLYWSRICKGFKEPRNRFQWIDFASLCRIVVQAARLHRLAESIPMLLKRLQIRALNKFWIWISFSTV